MDTTEGRRSTKRTTGCALLGLTWFLRAFLIKPIDTIRDKIQGAWSKVLYTCTLCQQQKMAKKGHRRNQKNKETGKRKPRKSAEQNQKQRKKEHDRMTTFNKKKEEEHSRT